MGRSRAGYRAAPLVPFRVMSPPDTLSKTRLEIQQ